MCSNINWSVVDFEVNKREAEQLNEEMRSAVLPVTIFVGIETVFGFLGNLLILYVYLFHYRKCNFKYFVLCLSVIDTTSTLTTMPAEIVTQNFWYVYPVPIICKIKSFFNAFTVYSSAFCLLIISIDRYRKICRPLGWQINTRVALKLCFGQLVFALIIAMPVGFLWGTHSYATQFNGEKVIVTVCEKDADYYCTDYPFIYSIITETICASAMMIMFVLYIFVCRHIFRSKTPADGASIPTKKGTTTIGRDVSLNSGLTSYDESVTPSVETMKDVNISNTPTDNDNQVTIENREQIELTQLSQSTMESKGKSRKAMVNKTSKTERPRRKQSRKVKRKTLIMLILTVMFIFTTVLFTILLNLIANDILITLTSDQKSAYLFFLRLYFINHVINPILYGILDPHFRHKVKQSWKSAVCWSSKMR